MSQLNRDTLFDNYVENLDVEYRVTAVIKNQDQEEEVKGFISVTGDCTEGYELIGEQWSKLQNSIDDKIQWMFEDWLEMQDEKL